MHFQPVFGNKTHGTLCGLLVNFQVHSCQLERKAEVTLPTAEKDYYSKGWAAKENLLDVSEYQKASQPPCLIFLYRIVTFSFSVCSSAANVIFLLNKRIKQKHRYGVAPYPKAHLQRTLITNSALAFCAKVKGKLRILRMRKLPQGFNELPCLFNCCQVFEVVLLIVQYCLSFMSDS